MTALDTLIAHPRRVEIDRVDLAAPAEEVWRRVRHMRLARLAASLDDLRSSVERPGFQIFADDPPREVAVAAIGQVGRLAMTLVHAGSTADFVALSAPHHIKVGWAIRVSPLGPSSSHVELEWRVTATD